MSVIKLSQSSLKNERYLHDSHPRILIVARVEIVHIRLVILDGGKLIDVNFLKLVFRSNVFNYQNWVCFHFDGVGKSQYRSW